MRALMMARTLAKFELVTIPWSKASMSTFWTFASSDCATRTANEIGITSCSTP
jgi:hypothetical protein